MSVNLPINLSEFNMLIAILAVLLIITMEFLSVEPIRSRLVIEKRRFRVVTLLLCGFFLMVVALRFYQLILFRN